MMIRATVRSEDVSVSPPRSRRSRFGLDAPLPADPQIVERAVLRLLSDDYPDLLVVRLARPSDAPNAIGTSRKLDPSRGVPDLLVLRPGGQLLFLAIRAQAHRSTHAERAFADLCRVRAIPLHTIRALPEARRVLERLNTPNKPEPRDGSKESRDTRRAP